MSASVILNIRRTHIKEVKDNKAQTTNLTKFIFFAVGVVIISFILKKKISKLKIMNADIEIPIDKTTIA